MSADTAGAGLTGALPVVVVLAVVVISALLGSGAASYPAGDRPRVGTGAATVDVRSMPATVTLARARFGAGTYRLVVPPAVVEVRDVRGNPDLTYTVDVPGLQLSRIAHYPLAGRTGRQTVALDPVEVSPHLVEGTRYEATVAVWVRVGDRYRTLAQTRVPVEVAHA